LLALGAHAASGPIEAPAGFEVLTVAWGFERPTGLAFAPDGRMFLAEQRGIVWVVADGAMLPEPFIDLREEVNGQINKGLLGIALDPDFLVNRQVYLLYTMDPIPGEPDEPGSWGTAGRLTRYTGTVESGGNQADPGTRLVLIGEHPGDGFPACDASHTVGTLRFALDGTLFVSAGDGAHAGSVDAGGQDPGCFQPPFFEADQDIGAFRAQYLSSLAGKILRIDPATGSGLPSNPYWTGNGQDNRSRVWVSGLRNPFRFAIRPGPGDGSGPGELFIGDVGWGGYEEVNVAQGGENFGWPCFEGVAPAPDYPEEVPPHSGCDSIESEQNPGPLTGPLIWWQHDDPDLSSPPGLSGSAVTGGVWYDGLAYPARYHGGYFFADYEGDWIKVLSIDESDGSVAVDDFASAVDQPVALRMSPVDHELYYLAIHAGSIRWIHFDPTQLADVNGDGVVDVQDLLAVIFDWGPCPTPPAPCPADVTGDGQVDVEDLLMVILGWS
jgi:glucose/arabinose dehydrogenase